MNRKAIVTGGSTGIGRATASALANSGHDMAITYQSGRADAETTVSEVAAKGRRCVIKKLDLSAPENATSCVDKMVTAPGGLDVDANTLGATLLIQKSVEHMLPSGLSGEPREHRGELLSSPAFTKLR